MSKPLALSRKLAQSMSSLREDFVGFTSAFMTLSVRRAHFAPSFMTTYERWQRETGRSFVAFVRELDPDMPTARAEYPYHRSYQAALYLRRLAENKTAADTSRSSVTPYKLLAAVLKGFLPLIHPHEAEAWLAIAATSKWRPRDIDRLKATVARVRPVNIPNAPRLVRKVA